MAYAIKNLAVHNGPNYYIKPFTYKNQIPYIIGLKSPFKGFRNTKTFSLKISIT